MADRFNNRGEATCPSPTVCSDCGEVIYHVDWRNLLHTFISEVRPYGVSQKDFEREVDRVCSEIIKNNLVEE